MVITLAHVDLRKSLNYQQNMRAFENFDCNTTIKLGILNIEASKKLKKRTRITLERKHEFTSFKESAIKFCEQK